jgi:quercetin dioxygenase-like cupin family protein
MVNYKISNMVNGWFVGDFDPAVLKTDQYEVCYKKIDSNANEKPHYHPEGKEITLVVSGKIQINDAIFEEGDIFVIEANETVAPVCLESGMVFVVRTCSKKNNKVEI